MRFLVANHSSYPADTTGEALRDEGDLADRIREQEAAGVDIVTDGGATGEDPVSHILRRLDGYRAGPLVPGPGGIPDVHEPVIEARLRHRRDVLVADLALAQKYAQSTEVKLVIPGPYTLARMARIATTAYRHPMELAAALADMLAIEVRALAAAGGRWLQIDEPAILAHPEDVRLLRDLLEPIRDAAGDDLQTMIATSGGDAEPLYAQLNSLPTDVVAVDLCRSLQLERTIADTGAGKILALGLVDGRRPELESPDEIARRIETVLHRYPYAEILLQPGSGLGRLPRPVAQQKLRLLDQARRFVAGGAA